MPWPTLRSAITRILLKGRKINNISGQCSYSRLIRSATVIFPLILFFFCCGRVKERAKEKKGEKYIDTTLMAYVPGLRPQSSAVASVDISWSISELLSARHRLTILHLFDVAPSSGLDSTHPPTHTPSSCPAPSARRDWSANGIVVKQNVTESLAGTRLSEDIKIFDVEARNRSPTNQTINHLLGNSIIRNGRRSKTKKKKQSKT